MRHTMIHNARKIDKKKLFEGEFGTLALDKNFANREQMEGDLQAMKDEVKGKL